MTTAPVWRTLHGFLLAALLLQVASSRPFLNWAVQDPLRAATARETEELHWRNHDFDQQHILLDVRFQPEQKKILGKVTHTIQPMVDDFKSVELDAVGLQIAQVKLDDGKRLRFTTTPTRLNIQLDRGYRAGETIRFTIEYSATAPKKGITFVEPDAGYPNRPQQIWSQGEAEEARHWIPLFDHPSDKATTEALVTVPRSFTAVSNGRLVGVSDNRDGTKTFHWKQAKPHSTYLFTVSAAEYVEILDKPANGVPIIYYALKDRARDTARTLGKTPAILQYFAEKIGFAYPWEKYATVLAVGIGGAMENTSATTMTENAIHDERAALDVSSDDVISHEIAHQWWGDTVTFRNWSDLWLSEGWASYFETLWEEHDAGWDQASYSRMQENQHYLAQAHQHKRPVVYHDYDDPEELFDITTYAKGGAVMHMLRFVLGDEGFWKSLNHHIRKRAFGNADTHDFKIDIEEATGQNLGWFFDEWLYKAGWPEFEVSYSYEPNQQAVILHVRQTQATGGGVPIFKMPVEIDIATERDRQTHRVIVDQAEQEFRLKANAAPLSVNFDPRNWLLKTLKFDKTKAEWLYQLKNDPEALNRLRAIQKLQPNLGEEDVIVALREALLRDKFWAVRSEAAQVLGEQEGDRIRTILVEGLKDPSSRVRRAVCSGVAKYHDDMTLDLLRRTYESDPSYFAAAEAISSLAKIGGPKAVEAVFSALQRDSHQEVIRTAALNGLAAMKDARALAAAMEYAVSGRATMLRTSAIRALGQLGKGKDEVATRLLELLKDGSTFVRFATVDALGGLGNQRAIGPLEEMLKGESNPQLKAAVQRAIERIQAPIKKSGASDRKAA